MSKYMIMLDNDRCIFVSGVNRVVKSDEWVDFYDNDDVLVNITKLESLKVLFRVSEPDTQDISKMSREEFLEYHGKTFDLDKGVNK
ncbi:hypothetical protein [Tenuibacillus multivorans]|uniref:Uncharacterized protein n=1 Tax=Tenuibacillus multivorans TaxID=237069 RepID=A0A1G9XQV9_9BACI|nr:hypothetical protein [Tenuibacillus multivorans]GEL75766.1 hypothetical protein TMU01_00010 [Tenuibacillus multivorans]SDM98786.1 hypothetical protein SAMN05216498_1060 [Tenuibacillus multivorans]